ncbi:MAG: hypothetical protein WAW84_03865, partial [Candidatus Rickettsiella isopodorum]
NAKAIEALLKANVNLFEIPPNKEPFLKRALQGRRRCAIKKLLFAHIRKNSSLMELVVGISVNTCNKLFNLFSYPNPTNKCCLRF